MEPGNDSLIGRTVDGRYRILERIARGGMATVYEAVDTRLDRVVALKIMHASMSDDPTFRARFQREARSAARLAHPNVVSIFDQGEDGELSWLAMELVDGQTLRDIVRDDGPLTSEQALAIFEPVLLALAAAHEQGFVHRDIKPENILISDDGQVKVTDFGLARAVSAETVTTRSVLIGTVAYLAPEQVDPGVADARSDVYATGVCLFEVVTGVVPYTGDSPLSVAYQHVNSAMPAPSSVRAGIPPEVDALVLAATQRDPDSRYPDARAMLADVRRVRDMLPAPRPLTSTIQHTAVLPRTAHVAEPLPHAVAAPTAFAPAIIPRRRRRRWPLVVGLVILIAAIAGAAGAGWYFANGPGKTVLIPAGVVGQTEAGAQKALDSVGLKFVAGTEAFSETVPKGLVISIDPLSGASVPEGATVTGVVSLGPERYEVPQMAGMTPEEASAALAKAKLTLGEVKERFDSTMATGLVVASEPASGEVLKPGEAVALIVSKGPKPVVVPDVTGRAFDEVKAELEGLGLVVKKTKDYSRDVPEGLVVSSDPIAGNEVSYGGTVTILVSQGPPLVEVPYLIDMQREEAIAALEGLGLVADVQEGDVTPLNRVYNQTPDSGTMVPEGSTVTISII